MTFLSAKNRYFIAFYGLKCYVFFYALTWWLLQISIYSYNPWYIGAFVSFNHYGMMANTVVIHINQGDKKTTSKMVVKSIIG